MVTSPEADHSRDNCGDGFSGAVKVMISTIEVSRLSIPNPAPRVRFQSWVRGFDQNIDTSSGSVFICATGLPYAIGDASRVDI